MVLYILYRIGQGLVLVMPLWLSHRLSSIIADLHYYTSKKDRTLVINNLKTVFGKIDKDTKDAAKEVMRNFAKYLVEFLRFSRMGREYVERHVKIEGLENLKRALEAKRGVIVFSGHIGNWEWGAAVLAILGFPVNAIALAHKDARVNNFFTTRRTMKGIENIPLGGSVRKSLERLTQNEIVAILSDRDFSNNSIPVNFFGKIAFMPVGIGVFAVKASCAIVPAFIVRESGKTYRFIIEKPIEYSLSQDKKKNIKNVVQKTTQIIEKYIRLYPEQWFMFYNPWNGGEG